MRLVLDPGRALPPYHTGYPMGLAVDGRGTLYYADLDLTLGLFSVGPVSQAPLAAANPPRSGSVALLLLLIVAISLAALLAARRRRAPRS